MNDPSAPGTETAANAPSPIGEYAQTCARYVQTAVGVPLDFDPQTLPLLDHYLRTARPGTSQRPETLPLLASVAGAYFGETLRRVFPCRWNLSDKDPTEWVVEFDDLPIRVFPIAIAREALTGQADSERETIAISGHDRTLVADRLERLPQVSEEDYLAPSTRFEVIELAVDIIKAHRDVNNT
jgi:hypothetical protein